ncbi:Ig-like domain-containing protein [Terrimonas alba]|uniref:Ig-like domain-containing protein n=1 Tax=Terrimonas alba TaxID=3349636 RepID=UPI0035F3AF88
MKKPSLIKIFFPFILSILFIPQILVQTGCATIIPPEGGPKDSLPPVLRRADPLDSSLNFSDNKITLVFDEYVNADNYQQELIVSPIPGNTPTVTRKLNTVTVKLRDTLQPNTTYSINFGNTIKDVNESNVLKNFTYIFSTGSYFDSLELAGNVVLAETGELDTTLTVMLHTSNIDSAVIKEKPRYITRLDNRGNFRFKNLPPDTFYVYALKDEGGSYRYLNPAQLFAFADSAVITGESARPVTLYAYAGKETEKTKSPPVGSGGKKSTEKRLKFSTNLAGPSQDLLEKFIFTFETPLKIFDSTKVHFTRDSSYTPITDYSWEKDSTMKVVRLNYNWTENVSYHLILEKDFATDTLGQQLLKADTIDFKTKQNRDYGKLTLRLRNLDLSKNPVLLFVQSGAIKKSFPLASATFSQSIFVPGEYSLRILNDDNKNGVWDAGKFFGERKQPELVKPISRTINVRPGLDNSFDINVTAPPAEPGTNPNPNRDRPNSNRPNTTRPPNQRF